VFLSFERSAGHTKLARKFATYPFFLTAPFRLDRAPSGMLTVFLQSTSGGLYKGDRLALEVEAAEGAQAHVTTQGATVAHAMPHQGDARHEVTIRAAAGSLVEYLPDPLILLPTANVQSRLCVEAEVGATVIFGDAFLTHDPEARHRPFRQFASEMTLRRPRGALIALERFAVSGGEAEAAWRKLLPHPCAAQGSVWLCSPHPSGELVAALGDALADVPSLCAGASTLPGKAGVVARLLAPDAVVLASGFRAAWYALRCILTGEKPDGRRKSGWL
jgi:urease accessory protein